MSERGGKSIPSACAAAAQPHAETQNQRTRRQAARPQCAHIPLHTVILGRIIRGQPKTNLKVTFEQEGKQIRYSKYHIKLM